MDDNQDPTSNEWILAQLPDPEPLTGGAARPPASEERLAKAEATLGLLSETVTQLAATVGRVAQDRPTAPGPVASAGPASHDELVDWVCWLIDRYNIGHIIPTCWAQHGALVDELDALRLGWLGTVAHGRAGLDALAWHEHFHRWLDSVRGRRYYCSIKHQPPDTRPARTTHVPQGPPLDLHAARYQPARQPLDEAP